MISVASENGAVLDSNLQTGGGTDDTAAIQVILNQATNGPLELIMDGPALVGPLNIYGNTVLRCLPGAGFYLKDGSNRALLRNANPTTNTPTDSNIVLIGGYYNGNQANQTGTGLFGTQESNGTLIGLIQFYGVSHVRIEDVQCTHSKTICVHFANAANCYVSDLWCNNNDGQPQQGGLQFSGYAQNIHVRNLSGVSPDDLCAFNADDAAWVNGSFTGLGPYIASGEVLDVIVNGIAGFGAWSAFRVFTASSRTDRIFVSGITGTFTQYIFTDDRLLLPGVGNIGTLVIDGVNALMDTAPDPNSAAVCRITGNAEKLVFKDFNIQKTQGDNRPDVYVKPGAAVGIIVYENPGGSVSSPPPSTTIIEDQFTAADNTLIAGRTPSPTANGNVWIVLEGASVNQLINSNQARLTCTNSVQSSVIDAAQSDFTLTASLTFRSMPTSAGVGILFRIIDANNNWLVWMDLSAVTLYKVQNGTSTPVQQQLIATALNSPISISIACLGQSITVTVNNSNLTATDAFASSATFCGIRGYLGTMDFDNFKVVA